MDLYGACVYVNWLNGKKYFFFFKLYPIHIIESRELMCFHCVNLMYIYIRWADWCVCVFELPIDSFFSRSLLKSIHTVHSRTTHARTHIIERTRTHSHYTFIEFYLIKVHKNFTHLTNMLSQPMTTVANLVGM